MIARVVAMLSGLFSGLVSGLTEPGREIEGRLRHHGLGQYAMNRAEQVRNKRAGRGRREGSKPNLYGNNRARRGGFKRRYSGHV